MRFSLLFPLAGVVALAAGCGNDMPSGPQGGPVSGAADMHCIADDGGQIAQETDQSMCNARPPDAMPADANLGPDAAEESDYGPTQYNQEGDDDDCKYHMKWTATPIYENYDVTFTLTVTQLVDGSPLTGADPLAEVYLNDTHPAPVTNQTATETSPGVYDIGPIQFDAPGQWTVRFHVYENCLDLLEVSPHGHDAFYVDVP